MNLEYVDTYYSRSGLTLSEQLYSHAGFHSVGMGHILSDSLSIYPYDKRSKNAFFLNIKETNESWNYRSRARFIVDNSQFSMGKRQAPGSTRNILMSIPTAMGYTNRLEDEIDYLHYK